MFGYVTNVTSYLLCLYHKSFCSINIKLYVNQKWPVSSFYVSLNNIAYGCQDGHQMHKTPCHRHLSPCIAVICYESKMSTKIIVMHWKKYSTLHCQLWWKQLQYQLERAVDGAPSQTPTLKFLTPSTPSPIPGPWSRQQNENSVQYVFYLLFVRTHTKCGIKIKIDMVTGI